MTKRNSVNLDVTPQADGFSIGGGTTARTLNVSGGDISMSAGGGYTYTFPGATCTLYGNADATLTATNLSGTTVSATNIYATTITGTTLSATDFSGTNVKATTVTGTTLSATTFSGTNVKATTVTGTTLSATDFSGTNVKATTVTGTTLSATTFSGTNVKATTITGTTLSATDFSGTNVKATTITGTTLSATDFSGTNVKATTITGTTLSATDFSGTSVKATTVTGTTLSATTFSGTVRELVFSIATLTSGDVMPWLHMPFGGTVASVYASLKTSGSTLTCADVQVCRDPTAATPTWTSITTASIVIDAGERTTETAASAAAISAGFIFAVDDLFRSYINSAGTDAAGITIGVKVVV